MKKKNGETKRSLIWAVDPFEKKTQLSKQALIYLQKLAKETKSQIYPVYIYSFPEGIFQAAPMLTDVQKVIRATKKYIDGLGVGGIHAPEVIFLEENKIEGRIDALLKFAKEKDANWIVASSHGRSGLGRAMFGSFAENLLAKSPWPVLFLRNAPDRGKKNVALFPTDFSSISTRAFENFLPSAKILNAQVFLFHSFGLPYLAQSPGIASSVIPPDFYENQEKDAKSSAKKWIQSAAKKGVKAQLLLKNIGMGFVTKEEVIKAANKVKASFIAMASTSKAGDRFLLGSTAYDVFRANKYPVWVFGPHTIKKPR